MIKSIIISRCTMSSINFSHLSLQKILNRSYSVLNVDDVKQQLVQNRVPSDKVNIVLEKKSVVLRAHSENIKTLQEILQKYDIDLVDVHQFKNKKFLKETAWTVEKRIMLLQEFGVSKVEFKYIFNFPKGIYLPVRLYKAHILLDADTNLVKNIFSYVENPKVDYKALSHLNDDMALKKYYNECFLYYLKNELDIDDDEKLKKLHIKKYSDLIYNSFRLLHKLIKLLKNELNFSNEQIVSRPWLLAIHPGQAENVINVIKTELPDVSLNVFAKYPRLLEYDLEDLHTLISHFRHYKITNKMIEATPEVFHLTSSEFKRRVVYLLENPFTLVFSKHTLFLSLVRKFHIILPRVRYLQENNYKFATIYSLTTFHNYAEHLVSFKKTNKKNLKSFFESQFDENLAQELLNRISHHTYHTFVSLVQMYETLNYIKQHFPKKTVHKHIYAILYNKGNLQAVHENLLIDPQYSQWSLDNLLALCVYKLEVKTHFTGEGIFLSDNDKTENLSDDLDVVHEEEKKTYFTQEDTTLADKNETKNLYEDAGTTAVEKNESCKNTPEETILADNDETKILNQNPGTTEEENNKSFTSKFLQGKNLTQYKNNLIKFFNSLNEKNESDSKKKDS